MQRRPKRDADREVDETVAFPLLLRALIVEEGFTEVKLRNPQTNEIRKLYVKSINKKGNGLAFAVE